MADLPVQMQVLPGVADSPVVLNPFSYATGDTATVVAASTGKKHRVIGLYLVAAGSLTVTAKSNSTSIGGAMSLIAGTPLSFYCPSGLFETTAGEALGLALSAATQVSGFVITQEV